MKTLTLLRHSKSSWADRGQADRDRPLNARGRAAARAMGGEMARLGLGFDRVVASPARRVAETLSRIAERYGPLAPAENEDVYLASVATLLAIVRESDDGQDRQLIVGHNPGMERLALLLSREGPLRDEVAVKYPTGALAELSFDAARWSAVGEGAGTLTRFIRPRDLDPELGPDEDSD